jgi:hypothetical protein
MFHAGQKVVLLYRGKALKKIECRHGVVVFPEPLETSMNSVMDSQVVRGSGCRHSAIPMITYKLTPLQGLYWARGATEVIAPRYLAITGKI